MLDVNDNAPVFSQLSYGFQVLENSAVLRQVEEEEEEEEGWVECIFILCLQINAAGPDCENCPDILKVDWEAY